MNKGCLLLLCAFNLAASAYALDQFTTQPHRIAVQAAMATGGTLGIGLTNYSETKEYGFTLSGSVNNASNETKVFVPVIYGGFRKSISDLTYFAYGIDLASKFGREDGETVKSNIFVGPYISLEQVLTMNMLLVGWIDPYSFEYQKLGSSSVTTQKFFGSGGIGFSYLFC
jgi:hypothetical protein